MRPIKVLYCIDTLRPGGTETQLAGLVRRLDPTVVEAHVCTLTPDTPDTLPLDCPWLRLPYRGLGHPQTLWALRHLVRYLRQHEIDIIQTFFQDPTVLGGFAGRLAQVPVRLASFRDLGFWRTPKQNFLMRRAYPCFTGFLANSEGVRQCFSKTDGLDQNRITVIPNGIDTADFSYSEEDSDPLVVSLVGNLNRKVKRTDLFLTAAAKVHAAGYRARWQIIGDGCLRPELEQLASELGLAESVSWLGRVPRVADVLGQTSIGVNCSDSEGFSNAVLEYMLCGCAVVATDVGGNREAVEQGKSGILVPPKDAEALARGIIDLMANEPQRKRLTQAARDTARRRFDWSRCVDAHQAYYIQVLKRS